MKNSDLFLELFDDDLLRPREDIGVESSSGLKEATPDDALSERDENRAPTGSQCESFEKSPTDETTKKPVRTEFDFCSVLDNEKEERQRKYNKMVAKVKGKRKLELNGETSLLHRGDTDSSEDEDNKYMDSSNYNSFGLDIKRLLEASERNKDEDFDDSVVATSVQPKSESPTHNHNSGLSHNDHKQLSLPEKRTEKNNNDYVDPFFGLRITEPVISREGMRIRMTGKNAVRLSQLQSHLAKNTETDFVVAGVLVRSVTKQAQNDSQYMIWELSELKEDKGTISVFLFGQSYKQLWKTPVATVVAILNPTDNNKKASAKPSDSFSVVVKQADQVMIWGKSKDYAICKSTKKSGERCTAFVNRSICEYCVYHVSKEYSKFSSSRSDIRSYVGNNGANFLRNKVLGKNEVFYGGKSYAAVKGTSSTGVKYKEKTNKVVVKDNERLTGLGCSIVEPKPEVRSNTISLPYSARAAKALQALDMDSHILKSLSSPTMNVPVKKIQSSLGNDCSKNKGMEKVLTAAKPGNTNSDRVPKLTDPADDWFSSSNTDKTCVKSTTPNRLFTGNKTSEKSAPSLKTVEKTKSKKLERCSNRQKTVGGRDGRSHSKPRLPVLTDPNTKVSESGASANKSNRSVSKSAKVDTPSHTGKDLQTKFKSLFNVASVGNDAKTKSVDIETSKVLQSEVGRSDVTSTQSPSSDKLEANHCSNDVSSATSSRVVQSKTLPSRTNMSRAKVRAMKFVERNGPIAKEDPNSIKKPPDNQSRKRERTDSNQETGDGKVVFSELYLQLMKQTSQQQDLVEAEKLRQEEEYFDKMGLKEQLEEKMLNTFKVDCKAVKCLQCKYVWFSAADMCKAQRHTLKIVDAMKRFFKCGNCNNRTVSLHILPVFSCTNCQASNWQRAPMMREKICKNENQLSIRGGEQKFTNSQVTNSSLNLLVPE